MPGMRTPDPDPRLVLGELVLLTVLLSTYIWFWQDTFPGDAVVLGIAAAALAAVVHLRRGESLRDLGFRRDTLPRAARLASIVVVPAILAVLLLGGMLESLHFPAASQWPPRLAGLVLFGLVQQYALLALFYRRIAELLPAGRATWVTAGVFAWFHVPNPFLIAVTFIGALFACWVYRRAPNLPLLGMVHGVVSFALYYSLPRELTFGLRVGAEF